MGVQNRREIDYLTLAGFFITNAILIVYTFVLTELSSFVFRSSHRPVRRYPVSLNSRTSL